MSTSANVAYALMSHGSQHECQSHEYELVANKSQPVSSATAGPAQQKTGPHVPPVAENDTRNQEPTYELIAEK